jgi:hypothetical protein
MGRAHQGERRNRGVNRFGSAWQFSNEESSWASHVVNFNIWH